MAVTPGYPGWTDMLRQGATTFWESWANNKDLSYLHSSFLYTSGPYGLSRAWAASSRIRRNLATKDIFTIRPPDFLGEGVFKARTRYDSIHGPIRSEWSYNSRTVRLGIPVPPTHHGGLLYPLQRCVAADPRRRPAASPPQVKGAQWMGLDQPQRDPRLQPAPYHSLQIPGAQRTSHQSEEALAGEDPGRRGQGDVRTIRQAAGPFALPQGNQGHAHHGTDDGAEHQGEQHRLPAQKGADRRHELDVAQPHRLARHHDLVRHDLEMRHVLRLECVRPDLRSVGESRTWTWA